MSLLADLLSKVKYAELKREIPPNLKGIVSVSARQTAHKRKLILLAGLITITVIAGVLSVYFMLKFSGNTYKEEVPVNAQVKETERAETSLDSAGVLKASIPKTPNSRQNDKPFSKDENARQRVKNNTPLSSEKTQVTEPKNPPHVASRQSISSPREFLPLIEQRAQNRERELAPKKTLPLEKTAEREPIETKNSAQIDAYLYSARNHELNNDYSQALSAYREILKIDKNNFFVMNNIAYILLHLGLISESIKYSQNAVALKKDYVPGLINLAIAYAEKGDIITSEIYLNNALEIEPTNRSVLSNLAILHERKPDYTKSSEYFLKLSRLGDVQGSLGLARIYEKQNKIEEAKKIYNNLYNRNSLDIKIRQTVRQKLFLLNEK